MDNPSFDHHESSEPQKTVHYADIPELGKKADHTRNYHHRASIISNKSVELEEKEQLLYGIDDVPPWYMCLFLGFQVIGQFIANFVTV